MADRRATFEVGNVLAMQGDCRDIPTPFRNFDDYWTPFLGGPGPAPGYTKSLPEERRRALQERLRTTLPVTADGRTEEAVRAGPQIDTGRETGKELPRTGGLPSTTAAILALLGAGAALRLVMRRWP